MAHAPLLALGLVVGAALLTVLVIRADLTLLAMVAALPWEDKLNFPTETLSAVKGIGALVLFAYVLRLVTRPRTVVHLPALLGVATAFILWVGVSVVTSTEIIESASKLIRYLLFFVFFFLVVQLVDGRPQVQRALRVFVASVTAAAVYGVWLYVTGQSTGRVGGPVGDPNDFAYLLACTLPLAAYLMTVPGARHWPWAVAFPIIAAAMLGTFSRGALVGLAALLAWGVVTRRVPIRALIAGAVAVVLVALLAMTIWKPLLDSTLQAKSSIADANQQSRESFWRGALQLTIRDPVTGVGPARFPAEVTPLLRNNPIVLDLPVTHNSYLEILSEDGVPALVLFLAYLGGVWIVLGQVRKRALQARGHRRAAAGHGPAGGVDRGDRLGVVPQRAADDAVLADRGAGPGRAPRRSEPAAQPCARSRSLAPVPALQARDRRLVRVALVSTLDRGGPVEQALLLAGELVARGADVRAICAYDAVAERFAAAGASAAVVSNGGGADVRAALAATRLARGYDVVHGHDRRANLWVRAAPRPRRGGARVITVHGLPDPYHPPPIGQERPGLRARVMYEGVDAGLSARADAVIVPSRAIAGELVSRLRYPEAKVVVVPNGIVLGDVRARSRRRDRDAGAAGAAQGR